MNARNAKKTLAIAVATAFAALSPAARAVTLNPHGTGQVLIYPYYTVNHQQTLVSIVNITQTGKALKVRFREGYDGREVASFNLYLAIYDTWVGAVFDTSADGSGGAAIATTDTSCTVPAFDATYFPGGPKVLLFSNRNYSQGGYGGPTGTDSGPTALSRTREGFFEVIEMGVVSNQSHNTLTAISRFTGTSPAPKNCAQVVDAWASGGYWSVDPESDIVPPIGYTYGAAGIVDVAEGTLYAYDATAIDGFTDVAQHTPPGDSKPNFSTAVTDSAHDIASAYVPIGNAMIKADYPASTRGVDAVSAVLMADTLYNEFDIDPALGAATDWLVNFPTKQFYVDPGIVGTAEDDVVAPFEQSFGGGLSNGAVQGPWACVGKNALEFDRDGHPPKNVGCGWLCPVSGGSYLCYETTIITFNAPPFSEGPSAALGSRISPQWLQDYGLEFPLHGQAELEFSDGAEQMRPSLDGTILKGLPAIGFAATNYINANVTPGVLSNYSGVYPHRSSASCTKSTNPQGACQ